MHHEDTSKFTSYHKLTVKYRDLSGNQQIILDIDSITNIKGDFHLEIRKMGYIIVLSPSQIININ